MQACTRGCYKTISTDFDRDNIPFVFSISQRSSEGRTSLLGFLILTHVNSAVMAEVPAPGVQFPQPLVNPPQVAQVAQVAQVPQGESG